MPAKGWRKKICGKCGCAFWCAPGAPVICMSCQAVPFLVGLFVLFVLFLLLLSFINFPYYTAVGLIIIVLFVVLVIRNGSETNTGNQEDSSVKPSGQEFSKTPKNENTRSVIKRSTGLSSHNGNSPKPQCVPVARRKNPVLDINVPQYTREFDSKLLQMLEEARSEGKTTCDIVSQHLHDRVVVESKINRITMACYAMWKLWEKQGSDMRRVINDTPSGQSNTITIRFETFFNEEKKPKNHEQEKFDSELLQMLEEARSEGKTTCDIVSKHLHDRVLFSWRTNRIPMARNAMWKLWEKQGSHEGRILRPRSKAEASFIKILFDTGLPKKDKTRIIQNKNLDTALKKRKPHERIQSLLDAGADVNACDWQGNTPLHQAIIACLPDGRYSDIDKVIEVLLEGGANANAQNNHGETPLDIVKRNKHLKKDAYCRLYEVFESQKSINNLLDSKFWRKATVNDVAKSISSIADINARDIKGNTLLHWATTYSKTPEVIVLLLNREADIKAPDEDGQTPLHLATLNNSSVIVELLLDKGANANAQNNQGKTPLDIAQETEHLKESDAYWRLYKAQSHLSLHPNKQENIDSNLLNSNFWREATIDDVIKSIDSMLDINARHINEDTLLHWAAAYSTTPRVILLLLERGANIKSLNKNGDNPLHWAAAYSTTPRVVSLLLDKGANIKTRNKNGFTPLNLAATYSKTPEVISLLLDAGSDIKTRNKNGFTPLHSAAMYSETPEMVKLLLDRDADIKTLDKDGFTPLNLAERFSKTPEVISLLLDKSINVKTKKV